MSKVKSKTFRTFKAALANVAPGQPILRIGYDIYVIGDFHSSTQIEVLKPRADVNGRVQSATVIGTVGISHLARLVNANHAIKGFSAPSQDPFVDPVVTPVKTAAADYEEGLRQFYKQAPVPYGC